ncbi:uncharacterized protein LOC141911050 isoform X2 [Tubulanus polymorphus]|uniref:uncharacterized protein LOC141911050 isoform X2 n=1 Tax=Tubulanus polymorphus TaxID=672921 RepID=UPI003DA4CBFA
MMWPVLLDLTREESKRVLRRLELEAYSSIVSAFRAQGDLNKDKKKILLDLQHVLSISTERHRAEVRRAVNDEKLTTVADNMCGPNVSSEWMIEGRRLIPLMPRLVPQTAFTITANNAATAQAVKNASMPTPSLTGNKDLSAPLLVASAAPATNIPRLARPASPTSNVVVLPSGMSIHIKGGLNTDDEEEIRGRKRKRSSSSSENIAQRPATIVTTTPKYGNTAGSTGNHGDGSSLSNLAPMKITFSKSPQRIQQSSSAPSQKVILVSSSPSGPTTSHPVTPSAHKLTSVPIMKSSLNATSTSSVTSYPKPSAVMPNSNNGNLGNIVTVATNSQQTTAHHSQGNNSSIAMGTTKIRPRLTTIQRPKLASPKPVHLQQSSAGNMQPVSGIQLKQVTNKPTIQIKQEGGRLHFNKGMKIITHALSGGAGTSKILPKPSSSGSSPVVVVSSSSQSTSIVGQKSGTSVSNASQLAGKVFNITTQGGKVVATKSSPNVVTVNPKTLQITAVKATGSTCGNKPNVIVVQKAQSAKGHGSAARSTLSSAVGTPFEKVRAKELVSFIRQDVGSKGSPSIIKVEKKVLQKPMKTDNSRRIETRTLSTDGAERPAASSSVLAELIHAVSMQQQLNPDTIGTNTRCIEEGIVTSTGDGNAKSSSDKLNEWVDYDVGDDEIASTSMADTTTTNPSIKGLLKAATSISESRSVDVNSLTQSNPAVQIDRGQFFHLDQSGTVRLQSENDSSMRYLSLPSNNEGAEMVANGQVESSERTRNLLGNLDPKTGQFYATDANASDGKVISRTAGSRFSVPDATPITEQEEPVSSTTDNNPRVVTLTNNTPMDIFSSALAQAQIDLDPYQFMDDEVIANNPSATASSSSGAMTGQQMAASTGLVSLLNPATVPMDLQQFQQQQQTEAAMEDGSSEVMETESSEHFEQSSMEHSQLGDVEKLKPRNVSVTVEPIRIDTSLMAMKDFTSQQCEENIPSSDEKLENLAGEKSEIKPSSITDLPSWTNSAIELLQRVSRFRGLNRERGDINAAAWFLQPVDVREVPDYYTIINNPMDFGTIKKKLETGQYNDPDGFHSDMILVRDNCHLYNPEISKVRQDCEQVFQYYFIEYKRMIDQLPQMAQSSRLSLGNSF